MVETVRLLTVCPLGCRYRVLGFSGLGVGGDFVGDAGFVAGEHDAEAVGHALVPSASPGEWDAAVDGLAVEFVGEDIKARAAAVGQVVVSGEGEQADAAGEGGVGFLSFFEWALEGGGGSPGGKNGSGNATRFEEAAVFLGEAVELEIDGGGESVGDSNLDFTDRLREDHFSVLGAKNALGAEMVEDGSHIERISGGVLVDKTGESGRKLFRA